ncbi:MAG TPA: acetamidase/formamidase family protein [Candidatus Dormibacteraeota bacterium]|nr:acetamidase/formamidase family protein [Candidatus Dormibacteraeota bacterium]
MTLHRFQPRRYHSTIGSHEPELRIGDGDTVATTTIDAGGRDRNGDVVAQGGNPQTGPFFVDGAEPGDVLAVTFDRLTPNRPSGYTGTVLAENVVDPIHVRTLPASRLLSWAVDVEAGTVRPQDVETQEGSSFAVPDSLRRLTLPLAPMVGCFGVAPQRGEAISTATSGRHGGNMDYRGFSAGVTVYLPVSVSGALFHIGDGHAVQGDGEIVGTGIEISFDVEFTCRVRRGRSITWPRGENADWIFAVGNARPLDQALQHATSEMVRWLEEDHGLDATAASILMGQAVHYDVGNVFDPAYTVVCRMSKELLGSLR